MSYEYKQLLPVLFGEGAIAQLGEKVKAAGCKKPLLVHGKRVKAAGQADRALDSLKSAGLEVAVFDKVESDAPTEIVDEGGRFAREQGVDSVVVIGGGSGIDAAKAMAALIHLDPPVEQYLTAPPMLVKLQVPIFIIPTTSGTGSEVTRMSVISHKAKNAKLALFFDFAPGSLALVDPELTTTAPPGVTAYAGLDALSHCTESITAKNRNPHSEVLALAAVERIFKYLPAACKNGDDIEARRELALASSWAGLAFSDTDVQFGHDLADTVSMCFHSPHGLNCGWATPEMLTLVGGAVPAEVKKIGEAAGLAFPAGMSAAEVAAKTAEAVRQLMRDCGVASMREMGFARQALLDAVPAAMAMPLKYNCPVDITPEIAEKVLAGMYDNYQ